MYLSCTYASVGFIVQVVINTASTLTFPTKQHIIKLEGIQQFPSKYKFLAAEPFASSRLAQWFISFRDLIF